uniref:Uncharacterized protein n=1 Tax=Rhizophora mucronata TaxID=61149 RepID=A0A2P2P3L8_RHIMU
MVKINSVPAFDLYFGIHNLNSVTIRMTMKAINPKLMSYVHMTKIVLKSTQRVGKC